MPLLYAPIAPYYETGLTVAQRSGLLGALYGCFGVYLWVVVANRPAGLQRLTLSLPVLVSNVLCCFIFHTEEDLLARTSTLFLISWLATFKVGQPTNPCYLNVYVVSPSMRNKLSRML